MQKAVVQSSFFLTLPGISHGFLSNHFSDAREKLDQAEPTISTVKQVHGDAVVWASALEKRQRDADGIGTFTPSFSVGVYSADCSPLLFAAHDASHRPVAVMAVHAGWRGTALQIGAKALQDFAQRSKEKGAIQFSAAIGPCISFESFEVGEEVVAAFPGSFERGQAKLLRLEGERKKYLFDLPGENKRQLEDCAARMKISLAIDPLGLCTLLQKDQFPSYRRDREKAGRILSYLSFQR